MPRRPRKGAPCGLPSWRDLANGSKTKRAKTVSPEMSQPASASHPQTGSGTFGGRLPDGLDPGHFVPPPSEPDSSPQTTPRTTTDSDTLGPALPCRIAKQECVPRVPQSGLIAAAGRAGLSRGAVEAHLNRRLGKIGKEQLLNAVRLHYKNYAGNSNMRGLGFPREDHLPYLPIVDLWVLAEKLKLTDPFAVAFNITLAFYGEGDKAPLKNRCTIGPGKTSPYCFRPSTMRAAPRYSQKDVQPVGYLEVQHPQQREQELNDLQEQGQMHSYQFVVMQHEQQIAPHANCWQQECTSEEHQQLTLTRTRHELHSSRQGVELPDEKEGMSHRHRYPLQAHPQAQNGELYGQPQQQDHADNARLPQLGLQDGHQVQSLGTFRVEQLQLQLELQHSHPQHQLPSDEPQMVPQERSHEETELPLFHHALPPNAVSLGSGSNTCKASLDMLSASRINRILASSDVKAGAAEARASTCRSLFSQLSCESDEEKSDEDESDEEWQPWATPQHRGVEPRLFGTDPAWHYAR